MRENRPDYEEYIKYFPKTERRALEQAIHVEGEVEDGARAALRQIERSNSGKSGEARKS
jgi:hypothetical protein